MKREIKFRGKDCNTGEWVYGDLHLLCDKPHIHTAPSNFPYAGKRAFVDPETVGQFTGLYDKNGKEIYEGDIVKCNGLDWTYTVVFYTTDFKLYRPDGYYFIIDKDDWFEVIGNIYDNKELLTQN